MKRLISLLLLLVLSFSLYGCDSNTAQEMDSPVNFYYCTNPIAYNSPDGVIRAEIRDAKGWDNDITQLIELYLKGPVSTEFTSPFPDGTSVEHLSIGTTRMQIVLNDVFAELNGIDLTLACACLARTLQEATQVEYVQISFESDSSGKRSTFSIGLNSLLILDDSTNSTTPEE